MPLLSRGIEVRNQQMLEVPTRRVMEATTRLDAAVEMAKTAILTNCSRQ
jgi:hypothetical protein